MVEFGPRQAPRESTIVPTIDDRGVVELPSSSPLAGRCPFEYDHPDEDSSIR